MSYALTGPQIDGRSKIVTRRCGWWKLKPGDLIRAVAKCMGLKAGEKMIPMAVLIVVSVRAEPLREMSDDVRYGFEECRLEGFGDDPRLMWPSGFVRHFCATHKGCTPDTLVNRIEFRYLPGGRLR